MSPSRSRIPAPLAAALAVALPACLLAGCGSGSSDSPVVSDPQATATVTRTVTAPPASTSTTATAPAPTTSTTTPPPSTGTTVPPPNPSAPLTLRTAEATLDRRGFATLTERDFDPDQTLKVLVGVRRSAPSGREQQAFFFVGDRFIGTDTADTSGAISVTGQGDDSVTLTYGLYKPSDPLDDPSDGSADVTYHWTGAKLVPTDTIPPSSTQVAGSRR